MSSHAQTKAALFVIFNIRKALILLRSSFQSSVRFCGLPLHNIFDLLGQFKVLVRDPLRGMILQANLNPGIGRGDVRMVPGCLGEVTNGVDDHQRTFPTVGAILATYPAILQVPVGQIALEPLLNLFIGGQRERNVAF